MLLTSDPYVTLDEQISGDGQVCTIELDHAAKAYSLHTMSADSTRAIVSLMLDRAAPALL